MADGMTIIKAPEEQMSAFNKRLLLSCGEVPVTSVQMTIIDGQPSLTLFSEIVDAEQDDVEAFAAEGVVVKEGDPVPAEDPVHVQVTPLRAGNLAEVTKSQERMETLYKRADGSVTAVLHATGKGIVKVHDPVTKKDTLVEKDVHYAAVVFNPSKEEADAVAGDASDPANG